MPSIFRVQARPAVAYIHTRIPFRETNPAWVIRDFMVDRLGVEPETFDYATVRAAAAYCDEREATFDWRGLPEDYSGVEFIEYGLNCIGGGDYDVLIHHQGTWQFGAAAAGILLVERTEAGEWHVLKDGLTA